MLKGNVNRPLSLKQLLLLGGSTRRTVKISGINTFTALHIVLLRVARHDIPPFFFLLILSHLHRLEFAWTKGP